LSLIEDFPFTFPEVVDSGTRIYEQRISNARDGEQHEIFGVKSRLIWSDPTDLHGISL
jgi:hypothetical protein